MKPHFPQAVRRQPSGLFFYLLGLTAFFLLFEISFTIQVGGIYLSDFRFVTEHLAIPHRVIPAIFYFVGMQLLLHFLLTVWVWGVARLLGWALACDWISTQKIGFMTWGLTVFFVLVMNQVWFPNSKFAVLLSYVIPDGVAPYLFKLLAAMYGWVILLIVWRFLRVAPKRTLSLMSGVVLVLIYAYWPSAQVIATADTAKQPNIILIGIDSLRPDYTGYIGGTRLTPKLDQFLEESTVFTQALTPIARTFPAWVSILSGEYPRHHGIRYTLANPSSLNVGSMLGSILQQEGYETIFATDETRFSNIDQRFGFDRILSAPIGFVDFLLGSAADLPVSNVLVNTRLGQYLFPYSHANRAAFGTYDPNTFLETLRPVLQSSRTKPLFLAVHFCLPHFPYSWGTSRALDLTLDNYEAAIARADVQFGMFMEILKQSQLLNHAWVVVLSDHGEAIELPGDRVTDPKGFVAGKDKKIPHFYPPSVEKEAVNESAGHGTDVLSLTQGRVLLAFRLYGLGYYQTIPIDEPTSLLDIKPTLLNFLGIHNRGDGRSLLNYILAQKTAPFPAHDFFVETDFSPQAIHAVRPDLRQAVLQGIDFFYVDPTSLRLMVKDDMGKLIILSKQYADFYQNWVLALYPQAKRRIPILVNLKTGQWTNDLHTPFARTAPLEHMLKALKGFYGPEIKGFKEE